MPPESDDAIDLAIALRAERARLEGYKNIRYVPSDGDRKRATKLLQDTRTGAFKLIIKGAPQKVLLLCKLSSAERKKALEQVEKFAKDGFRTIAVAVKPLDAT